MKYLLIIVIFLLSSCADKNSGLNPYQPSILRPIKGSKIETIDGIYHVQTDNELWHSDKRYRELEREIYAR